MATTYKVLGQAISITSTGNVLLYSVPTATSTIGSTVTVCNQGTADATYSISVRVVSNAGPAAALTGPVAKEYLAYQVSIPAKTTTSYTLGITLDAFDHVVVSASTATVSFNLFGTEIS